MNPNLCVILCVIMAVIILALLLKIHFLRKSCREISEGLADIAAKNFDTNTLLTISSRDRGMCRFTALLNRQLAGLRQEHLRYKDGDRKIKEAITNISHDLRTPLTAISGYLDLLSRELSAPGQSASPTDSVSPKESAGLPSPDALRYLSILQNRTSAMKELTEELFRYSMVLSEKESAPIPLSLNQALEESLISAYGELRRCNITPVINIPGNSVLRTLDEAFLTRIFDNILSNAVKYSGGDLEVVLTEDGQITFSNLAPGLTPVMAARLFDRYYTVETIAGQSFKPTEGEPSPTSSCPTPSSAAGSSGLGLSIAKLLTERMGGMIRSDYKNGRLYITVQFPR